MRFNGKSNLNCDNFIYENGLNEKCAKLYKSNDITGICFYIALKAGIDRHIAPAHIHQTLMNTTLLKPAASRNFSRNNNYILIINTLQAKTTSET